MEGLTLRDLDKLDIIEITNKDIDSINKWYFTNINYIKNNIHLIKDLFKETVIIYANNILHKNGNEFKTYWDDNGKLECFYGFCLDIESKKEKLIFDNKLDFEGIYNDDKLNTNNLSEYEIKFLEWMKQDSQVIMFLIIYISLNQEHIIKQTKTHTKKNQSKKDKRAGKKPKVKLIKQTIIRLNTDHIPEPTEEEKRLYERHTLGWTVRGHWRTYQSGKKTWIKPQVRGDKDNVEGKIYEV